VPSSSVNSVKCGCSLYEMDIIKLISQCPADEVVKA
jgi:hypothetical protein